MVIQKWVTDTYSGIAPLAIEFHLWNEIMGEESQNNNFYLN